MIHELRSTPSNRYQGTLKNGTKWETFIGRSVQGQGHNRLPYLALEEGEVCQVDYLTITDQRISDCWFKIVFLEEVQITVRLGKMDLAHMTPF